MASQATRSRSRRKQRKITKRFQQAGVIAPLLIMLAVLLFHGPLSRWFGSSLIRFSEQFRVKAVTISGQRQLGYDEIFSRSQIKINSALFAVDPGQVATNIRKLPWVKDCQVHRRFPDQVDITVTERTPIAALRAERMYVLTEDSAAVLPTLSDWVWDLPIVTPPRVCKVTSGERIKEVGLQSLLAQAISARHASADAWHNISELYYRGDEAYATLADPPVELRLGKSASELAWSALDVYLTGQNRVVNQSLIDLSVPGKLIVATQSSQGEERENG